MCSPSRHWGCVPHAQHTVGAHSLGIHPFPTDGAHACQQRGQLHLGALPAGPRTSAEWPAQSQPTGQSPVSVAGGAVGRVHGFGMQSRVTTFHSTAHMPCVCHTAPSSPSSSGPSTRCWHLCTSSPAGTTMESPPKTSARFEGLCHEAGGHTLASPIPDRVGRAISVPRYVTKVP